MTSFNAESIFTKILLRETIDLRIKIVLMVCTRTLFMKCLTVNRTESVMLFDNEYYKQYDGVAMRPPLGPSCANIFLYVHYPLLRNVVKWSDPL